MNMMTELKDVRNGPCCARRCASPASSVGGDRVIDVRNPYTGALVGTVPKATVDDVRRAFAIAQGLPPKLTRHDRYRILHRAAEIIRGAHRRDLRPDHRRVRHLQEGLALRGRPRLRRLRVRRQRGARRRRPGLLLRSHAARQEAQGLHAARAAARRDLRDHAVQPSAEPGRAQGRAVDRHQQPDGAEAHREDAADRAAARRHPLRGRAAAGDVLGRHRRPARDRRRDADEPRRRPRHLHRRRADRQVHRRQGGLQAAGAGARRQRSRSS